MQWMRTQAFTSQPSAALSMIDMRWTDLEWSGMRLRHTNDALQEQLWFWKAEKSRTEVKHYLNDNVNFL